MAHMKIVQVRWANISMFMALVIYTAFCNRALRLNPLHVNTETDAAPLSSACMHPVTIISAYYPLNVSKHSSSQYDEWMANFFPYVSAPIVLYSPPGGALARIRELRGDLPMTVKVRKLINRNTLDDKDDSVNTLPELMLLASRTVGDTCHQASSHGIDKSATRVGS
jgi:hypothetical protein